MGAAWQREDDRISTFQVCSKVGELNERLAHTSEAATRAELPTDLWHTADFYFPFPLSREFTHSIRCKNLHHNLKVKSTHRLFSLLNPGELC